MTASVGEVLVHQFRLPPRHHVVVGDHARARFQVLLQIRPQDLVGIGRQVDGHDVGRAEIDLQEVAVDHSRVVLQAEPLNPVGSAVHQSVRNLDADRFGAIALHGGDQNAAVAAAQVVKRFARLQVGQLQHAVHNLLRRNDIGRQTVGVMLGPLLPIERRLRKCRNSAKY